MATAALKPEPSPETMADLLHRLGDIPPERVLMRPPPGTATEEDLVALLDGPNKRICELVDGTLVEKALGFRESVLAAALIGSIWRYLDRRNVGVPCGAIGPIRLHRGLVRIPDVCLVSWKRLGSDAVPDDAISKAIPELIIEVLRQGNTRREIDRKLQEYFRAGVLLAWIIDPTKEIAEVYTSPTKKKLITAGGVLEGRAVFPGLRLYLEEIFAKTRRRG